MADERAASTVVAEIVGNAQEIIRSELRLAQAELTSGVRQAAEPGALIASGVGLSLFALGLLIALIVLLLAHFLDARLAVLITFIAVAATGVGLIFTGRRRWSRLHIPPDKAARSIEGNASWLKAQLK